jgi:hypothetical protein
MKKLCISAEKLNGILPLIRGIRRDKSAREGRKEAMNCQEAFHWISAFFLMKSGGGSSADSSIW